MLGGLPSQCQQDPHLRLLPQQNLSPSGWPFHNSSEKQILWHVGSHKGRKYSGTSSAIYLFRLRTEQESAIMPDVPLVPFF